MKRKSAFLIFIVLGVALAYGTYFVIDHTLPKETFYIPFDFETSSRAIGINADPDALHFGKICTGCSGIRGFTITNNQTYKQRTKFFIGSRDEPIGHWFKFFPTSEAIISSGEELRIKATVKPETEEKRWYNGTVILEIYKAWPWEEKTKEQRKLHPELLFVENYHKVLEAQRTWN